MSREYTPTLTKDEDTRSQSTDFTTDSLKKTKTKPDMVCNPIGDLQSNQEKRTDANFRHFVSFERGRIKHQLKTVTKIRFLVFTRTPRTVIDLLHIRAFSAKKLIKMDWE